MAFLFMSSIIVFPEAYSPVTKYISSAIYNIFFQTDDEKAASRLADAKTNSVKNALSRTIESLKSNIGTSNEKLVLTLGDTKTTLDKAISRTNEDLKDTLSNDIEDRLDISGGTLSGDLTIEDNLIVEDTSTMQDILPDSDDTYDLGSISKGWNNVYVHTLHGSSIITVGDGSTSHSLSDSDDMLITGDLEVNGTSYLDGAFTLGGTTTLSGAVTFGGTIDAGGAVISNLADPASAQDAVTRAYYEANTPAGVFSRDIPTTSLYPTTSGDDIDMLNSGLVLNIGNASTDFTAGGGLNLAGVLTASSASAHTLGSLGVTAGAVTGVTNLTMTTGVLSGVTTGTIGTANITTLDLGTNTITDGSLTGDWTGITDLTVDNININGNTIDTTSGDLTITANGGDISFGNETLTTTGTTDFGATTVDSLDVSDNNITNVGNAELDSISSAAAAGSIGVTLGSSAGNDFLIDSTTLVVEGDSNQVGIGLVDPSTLLEVYSATVDPILTLNSGSASYDPMLQFKTNGSATVKFSAGVESGDDEFKIYAGDYSLLTNGLADTDQFVINGSGTTLISDLEIGAQSFETNAGVLSWIDLPVTTTENNVAESYSAMIDGSEILTVYALTDGSGGVDTKGVGINNSAPAYALDVTATGTGIIARFNSDNATGCTLADGGTITCSSDIKLKKNISELSYGLDTLMDLRPVGFNWKSEDDDTEKSIGFIAQEVEQVIPGLVNTDNVSGYKELNTIGFVPILTKAIQEQQGQLSDIQINYEDLDIKADTSATTVAELQTSTNDQFAALDLQLEDIGATTADLDERLSEVESSGQVELMTELQDQMDTIQDQYTALSAAITAMNLDNLIYKDADVNILDGKLVASEIETGVLTISVTDEDAPTIGEAEITAVLTDEDEDGVDDETGSDGLSVVVETGAAVDDSKIFVTPKVTTDQPLAVTEITDGESFKVEVAEPVIGDTSFDWWIVGVKP